MQLEYWATDSITLVDDVGKTFHTILAYQSFHFKGSIRGKKGGWKLA